MNQVILAAESVEAVARRTVELFRNMPADSDPWLTREQAEKHLNVSRAVFYRLRQKHPEALAPAIDHPPRWSRNALDMFKSSGGRSNMRPVRKRMG